MKKEKSIRKIIVIAFLAILGLATYVTLRGSYLEYKELGERYLTVFWTNLGYKHIVMGINFVILYIIIYFTNRGIKKGLKVFFEEEKKQMPKLPNKSIALVLSVVASIVVGIIFTPKIMLCTSKIAFGESDPIFNLDISFFMFIEPLLKMAIVYIIILLISSIIYSLIYYVIVFNKYFDGIDKETLKKSLLMTKTLKSVKLLSVGIALFTLVSVLDIVFDTLLTTDNEIKLVGAGFTDVTIKLWGYTIFAVIIVISIFKAVKAIKMQDTGKILKSLMIMPGYLVGLFVVMTGFNLIFVKTNEFDKEKEYIEYNIENTKNAYGINCETETIEYSGTITVEEAQRNKDIIYNTPIVSRTAVSQSLEYNQTEKGYYTYKRVFLSKYTIEGKPKLVYVSPREILNSSRTYNSKTYEYTHGYGLILASATSVTEDGNVEYVQNDITGNEEKLKINSPRIYYGLETDSTVVTNAKNKSEYDYTDSAGKEYENTYDGESGLTLNFLDRAVLGISKGDLSLAFSSNVTSSSKILINRNILKRAKLALPDLIYDEQAYTVVDENGDIYWVIDAYTTSNKYPYSTSTEIVYNNEKQTINYIRNSIKIIIDAYDGTMKFYITDRTDPIAMAYQKIYPDLFEDKESEIPSSIAENFVYPKFLYDVQSAMLEEYHNTKADVLYRSDDTWERATYNSSQITSKSTTNTRLESYYTMYKDEKQGLIQMYSGKDKQNITSYLVGTVENGQNKLKLTTINSDTGILGPAQLDTQILQDEAIQSEIKSLNVTGAKVTKEMIIVPIENTLLYVEPIYQTMINESNIPILKKVIVASGNKVAIGDNLQDALTNLLSQYATSIELENTENIDGLIQAIIKANKNLTDSVNSKDWELMGSDIKKLQELINELDVQVKEKQDNQNRFEEQNDVINNIF